MSLSPVKYRQYKEDIGKKSTRATPIFYPKMAINRQYEIMGMNEGLKTASDLDVLIEGIETPDSKMFSDIAKKDGIKAALKWRDSRFDDE